MQVCCKAGIAITLMIFNFIVRMTLRIAVSGDDEAEIQHEIHQDGVKLNKQMRASESTILNCSAT
jgi:hypothetical protein